MSDTRKLETTSHPGIYRRHSNECESPRKGCACQYVVRWKHRGKSHKRYFRTLALAREFKGKLDGGERQAPTRQSVADYFEEWIDRYRGRTSRGLEQTTRDLYRRSFEHHVLRYPIARMRLRDVTSRDVSDWFGDLEAAGATSNTVRLAKAALSAMLATAAQAGDIPANPALGCRYVPQRATPKRKRRQLTVADVDAILSSFEPPWRLFFELMSHTGMRVSELLGLTWVNVHLGDDAHIRVVEQVYQGQRKRLKTEGSERRIPLSPGMAKALTDWKGETDHPRGGQPCISLCGGYATELRKRLQPRFAAGAAAVGYRGVAREG